MSLHIHLILTTCIRLLIILLMFSSQLSGTFWPQNLHFCPTYSQCEVCGYFAYCFSCLCSSRLTHKPRPVLLAAVAAVFPQWLWRLCVSLWGLCTVHDEAVSFFSLWDFPYSYVCAVLVHMISNISSSYQTAWALEVR